MKRFDAIEAKTTGCWSSLVKSQQLIQLVPRRFLQTVECFTTWRRQLANSIQCEGWQQIASTEAIVRQYKECFGTLFSLPSSLCRKNEFNLMFQQDYVDSAEVDQGGVSPSSQPKRDHTISDHIHSRVLGHLLNRLFEAAELILWEIYFPTLKSGREFCQQSTCNRAVQIDRGLRRGWFRK